MARTGETDPIPAAPSVFLSYASEDRSAARSIRDALAAAGLDVWYDENELGGGDEWDQKIRRQIRDSDYFMPVISGRTEARHEGYFRREWRLAVDRTLDMADGHVFLLPVVIDDTDQAHARVPDRFVTVQWLSVPGGQPTPGLRALCTRLAAGTTLEKLPPRRAKALSRVSGSDAAHRPIPPFPVEEPGQRVKFWFHTAGWACEAAWIKYRRLPRWIRFLICIWLFFFLLDRGCSSDADRRKAQALETAAKSKDVGNVHIRTVKPDLAKIGTEIANAIVNAADDDPKDKRALMAIPFAAASDPALGKLADASFPAAFGKLEISHPNQVGLSKEPLVALDVAAAVKRGLEGHASYVLCGGVEGSAGAAVLTVDIIKIADGTVVWTKSYPASADAAAVASDIDANVPPLDDN